MKRRDLLLAAAGIPLRAAAARPNILWLSCEDMSPDLGCYGDPYARTPRIDRLASEGMRYLRAFSVAGVCAPSRSGIITSMYPTTIGTHHMRSQGVPPSFVKCFPEYLRAAGYYCTNRSKTDYNLGQPATGRPDNRVPDFWNRTPFFQPPVGCWDASSISAHWRGRPAGAPFFAVFNFEQSHEGRIRGEGDATAALAGIEQKHDPARAVLPPYYPDTELVRKDWATYHDLVTAVDQRVGQVLDELRDDGLERDTIVFFWSDHGRGLPRAKRWLYDSGIHVPLIVRWPGQVTPGSTSSELINLIDLAPTMLSIAGIPVPKYMQGRPFLGARKATSPRYIFGVRDRMDEQPDRIRSVRDERFKYIRNYQPERPYAQAIAYMDQMPSMKEWRRLHQEGRLNPVQAQFFADRKPTEELYDCVQDPHETRNLAESPQHQATLRRMRKALEVWEKRTGDLGRTDEKELLAQWRPGGVWQKTATPVIRFAEGRAVIGCATEGATVEYAIGNSSWRLYTGPISQRGEIRARAGRLGFADSEIVRATW